MTEVTRVVIVGTAGRNFHDFNVVYRDDFDGFVARARRSG
jgi:predicted GTPase